MANVNFKQGSAANFLALATKDVNTLYFLDNGQLYKGDMLLSNNVVLIPEGDDYPTTGVLNTIYAKASGECAFWNGSGYTLISRSVMTELEALEDRINKTIRLALTKGMDAIKIIQRTITEIESPDITIVGINAFAHCSQLTSVDLPNVTKVDISAFEGCYQLTSINLPNVTSIGDSAFQRCSSLTSINLPNVTSIGSDTFKHCTKLTKIIIGTEGMCTLKSISAFFDTPIASGMGYIYMPDDMVDIYKTSSSWSTYSAQIKSINELS